MQYEEINGVTCDAEESDWLDVSYTERKYINAKSKSAKPKRALKKGWKVAIIAVLCVATLAVTLFVDGDFRKEVFAAVKTATTALFGQTDHSNKINVPCNLTLEDVTDGVMTFSGGRAALSLTDGTVTKVEDGSVTISIDENTCLVYSGLTTVFVQQSQTVSASDLLGKYDGKFVASILRNGEVVKQVVGSPSELSWNV